MMPVHRQLPVTGHGQHCCLPRKPTTLDGTCLLPVRPEIANEVAVSQARLQLSVVASSANLDSLHLDKRNGDTALHLTQRTDGAVCTIDGKKGNSAIIGKANLVHISRIVLATFSPGTVKRTTVATSVSVATSTTAE